MAGARLRPRPRPGRAAAPARRDHRLRRPHARALRAHPRARRSSSTAPKDRARPPVRRPGHRQGDPGRAARRIEGMGHDLPRGAWPQIIGAITENAARAGRPPPSERRPENPLLKRRSVRCRGVAYEHVFACNAAPPTDERPSSCSSARSPSSPPHPRRDVSLARAGRGVRPPRGLGRSGAAARARTGSPGDARSRRWRRASTYVSRAGSSDCRYRAAFADGRAELLEGSRALAGGGRRARGRAARTGRATRRPRSSSGWCACRGSWPSSSPSAGVSRSAMSAGVEDEDGALLLRGRTPGGGGRAGARCAARSRAERHGRRRAARVRGPGA